MLSDAETGLVEALLDAGAVTALRTGAAAAIAAETLGGAGEAAVIGAGVNGRAAARSLKARGREVAALGRRRGAGARGRGRSRRRHRRERGGRARGATCSSRSRRGRGAPAREGSLRPGQHVSLMGADGPGKAEIAVAEIRRSRIFCDEWEQASHGGDLAAAVEAGAISRTDVTDLGAVLTARPRGRALAGRDHDLRLDGARDPGSRDRDRRLARAGELDLVRLEL